MDHRPSSDRNFFTDSSIDRVSQQRRDDEWLAEQLASPKTLLIPVWKGQNLFTDEAAPAPVMTSATKLRELAGETATPILLGVDGERTYFAVDLPLDEESLKHQLTGLGHPHHLKQAAGMVDRRQAGLLAYANAITHWHRSTAFCGVCGSRTISSEAGHLLTCSNQDCRRQHFPRTDPAIIVLVTNNDSCLLGRQPVWPPGLYSTIAGFVEPGETLEQAVAREVQEETGVVVKGVSYASSQPWPFPGSIMLGFYATAERMAVQVDGDELEDARWLSRKQMLDELRARRLRLPLSYSIARCLIEDWFDAGNLGNLRESLNLS
jgi:NAD+ diphosphatase